MSTEPTQRRSIVASIVQHFREDAEARRLYEQAQRELAAEQDRKRAKRQGRKSS